MRYAEGMRIVVEDRVTTARDAAVASLRRIADQLERMEPVQAVEALTFFQALGGGLT
jgi:hypothetical protein